MSTSSGSGHRIGTVAKVSAVVVAGAAVLAIPSLAAANAVQSQDEQVSPGVRNAVLQASLSQRSEVAPVTGPIAGGGGALEARVAPAPTAMAAGVPAAGPAAAVPPGAPRSALPAPAATKIVSQKQLLALVKKHFPADQIGNAMAVAQCESGQRSIVGSTNPDGTTDWGIFQLNDAGTLQGSLRRIGVSFADTRAAQVAALNPVTNVKAAGAIYKDRGWSPWVCAYKQQIVASLYSNEKGPMYGRYSVVGGSLGPLNPSAADLAKAKAKEKEKAKAKAKEKEKQKAKDKEKAKAPAQPAKPSPTPTPSTSPSASPAASATP